MVRYWQVAPGEAARFWQPVWKKYSIINMGYSELADFYPHRLSDVKDYNALKLEIQKIADEHPDDKRYKCFRTPQSLGSNASMFWNFVHEMKEGDFIVANKGRSEIVGIGIIQSPVKLNGTLEYKFTRTVKWLTLDMQKEIPDELKGKFGKTISELSKEEFDLLKNEKTRETDLISVSNENFKKIQMILDYKKQVILVGPPGTGKTYIAKEFVNSRSSCGYGQDSISSDKKFYWYVTKLENWGSELQKMLEKNEESDIWTKREDGEFLKDPSSFSNIKIGDVVFVYITPEKRLYGIATCSRKELDSEEDPIVFLAGLKYLENGPGLDEIKNDPILKNAKRIHSNLGTLFPLPQQFGLRLLELAKVHPEDIGFTRTTDITPYPLVCNFVTFHPSYSYEEFMEGLRPNRDEKGNIIYEIQEGIFKRACREALNTLLQHADIGYTWKDHEDVPQFTPEEYEKIQNAINMAPCYLIIDEINRGDVSRIFGELITLIEADKRLFSKNTLTCLLPYSKMKFGIPPNLHIIGTMNTADRSISLMDIALRRRFGFIELSPDYVVLDKILLNVSSLDPQVKNIRELSIKALQAMNTNIRSTYDRDHQIGHSYLMKLSDVTTADETKEILQSIWMYEIIPLLQEYFYDSSDKMARVLSNRFVEKQGTSFTIRPEKDIVTALAVIAGENSPE